MDASIGSHQQEPISQQRNPGHVNDKYGLGVDSVKEVASISSLEAKPEDSGMNARVEALWEQMNKQIHNKTAKPFADKRHSTVNITAEKKSDSWMRYLGLVPKEATSSGQERQQQGTGVIQNDTSDEENKVTTLWEQMNRGVSNKTIKSSSNKIGPTVDIPSERRSDNWRSYLGLAPKRDRTLEQDALQNGTSDVQNGTSDEAKRLAAAALAAVKDAALATSNRGKVEITEVRDFAGQEVEYKKLVDVDSREAFEKTKAPAPSAVDAVLEQIKKKQKLSVLDKTKKDWGEYKENKGVEEELDAYKKSSNQYLEKVSFLQRADVREFERERDARLAQQARRRPDMREDP
ncbi:craniofacial development protein 1-like isoform X2 [Tripterygium wilfordii]|uniref:craniofacial development protein 1-like isoform X2 n=1 Tax=Tripterygium wilfordii TaxID=458696 RepID=UPI0018F80246|nr:craniofacial development protein 1-like isoform X2 [Tripterygium wilfordii]